MLLALPATMYCLIPVPRAYIRRTSQDTLCLLSLFHHARAAGATPCQPPALPAPIERLPTSCGRATTTTPATHPHPHPTPTPPRPASYRPSDAWLAQLCSEARARLPAMAPDDIGSLAYGLAVLGCPLEEAWVKVRWHAPAWPTHPTPRSHPQCL